VSERSADWYRQAEADLRHAGNARAAGDYEWSCFAAQQAAEKAVKALIQSIGGEAWGHAVTLLLGSLADRLEVDADLVDAARRLDKHYLPARYPNGFDQGAPTDFYTDAEAEAAIADASEILEYCGRCLGRS
jgi:HEPN domain-containing protein